MQGKVVVKVRKGLLGLAVLVGWSRAEEAAYEAECDRMVLLAQEAGRAYNAGEKTRAWELVSELEKTFEAATKLDATQPQAYLNMAVFRLNSHDFQAALELFDETSKRLPMTSTARSFVDERVAYSKLGLYSRMRDEAYAGGRGDIREALRWTRQQRELAPKSPRAAHDMATLSAVLDDVEGAEAAFAEAQAFSAEAAARYAGCDEWRLSGWTPADSAERERYGADFEFVGGVVVEIVEDAVLAGPDSIVYRLETRRGRCATLDIVDAAPTAEIHANLWLDESFWWPGPPRPYDHSRTRRFRPELSSPRTLERAAFATPYASTNYYHLLTDVVPRLVALGDRRGPLLVPALPDRLKHLLALASPNGSFVHLPTSAPPGPRLRVGRLAIVRVGSVVATRPSHSLAPPPLLRAARDALLARVASEGSCEDAAQPTGLVVYASRRSASTRRFANESALVDALPARHTVDFDGAQTDIPAAIAIFRRAHVVVGVHGAALANALFCQPGALLVELGFPGAAARHYEHLAAALGLRYRRVLLRDDDRAFAASLVVAEPAALEAVVAAVDEALTGG